MVHFISNLNDWILRVEQLLLDYEQSINFISYLEVQF